MTPGRESRFSLHDIACSPALDSAIDQLFGFSQVVEGVASGDDPCGQASFHSSPIN